MTVAGKLLATIWRIFEGARIYYPQYNPQDSFDNVDNRLGFPKRCESCWTLRLEKTAQFSVNNGIGAFTTTLLISPHQDIERIKDISMDLASKYKLEFISRPFRRLFSQGRKTAKQKALYRQNYCGCVFSEQERQSKIKNFPSKRDPENREK